MSSSAAELLAHEAFVVRLARSLSADEAAAEDLVQETWLAALEGCPSPEPALRSWLARVLCNLAVSRLRRRTRRTLRESACARPERLPDTVELVERVELHHRLVAAVLGLPEAYREVILRHYLRGESVQALAAGLGRPEATVRTRLRRARARLRQELHGRFFGDRSAVFLAELSALDSAGRWTSDWIMKKALIQTPLIVSGLVGAGLGFSGTLLIHEEPRAHAQPPSSARSTVEATASGAHAAREPEPVLVVPALRSVPARREPARTSSASMAGAPSEDDLRRLLLSADRLDQVRAIRSLVEAGTPAAHGLLLETFLTTSDEILIALLEEAILGSDVDVVPAILEAYRTSLDPRRLTCLTSMLAELVGRDAALEATVVGLALEALRDPGPDGERLADLGGLLGSLGEGALDALAEYLADPFSDPAGVQVAVAALKGIDPAAAERVRASLGDVLGALIGAIGGPALTEEERRALRERTSSVAWAASGRPPDEHDSIGELLSAHLFRAADMQQAQTLAWGMAGLEGLSEGTRARLSRSILEALPEQRDQDLRQTYVWAVSQLVTHYGSRPLDPEFFEVLRMVEDALQRGRDPAVSVQLSWLLRELEQHREKKEG